MLCNSASYYPNKIDEMTFFQDNNLEKIESINHYNSLIAQGKYSEASEYVEQQEGIYGFFASYLNLIENRIYSLQEHLLNKPPKKQPFVYYDEEVHFSINELKMFDENDEEEDISSIQTFSDNDEQEPIEGLFTFTGEEAEPPDMDNDMIWI